MELVTIQEAAQMLRVNPITVRRHIQAGELEAVRVGRGVRVRKESLDRFIKPVAPEAAKQQRKPRGKPTSADDPLWNLVGIGQSREPGDVSENKHRYLADAYLHHHIQK